MPAVRISVEGESDFPSTIFVPQLPLRGQCRSGRGNEYPKGGARPVSSRRYFAHRSVGPRTRRRARFLSELCRSRRACGEDAKKPLAYRSTAAAAMKVCELGRRVVRRDSCTLVAEAVAGDRTLTRMQDTGFPLDQLFCKSLVGDSSPSAPPKTHLPGPVRRPARAGRRFPRRHLRPEAD